jgi:peptidoglycan/xylan/chitin deacetylase (PgdA/CDA1 family)
MYLVNTPQFIQKLFPNFIWQIPTNKKELFLTFDDGPVPGVTPDVLNVLDAYNASATFFMVGKNIKENQELFQEVLDRGHQVGNHTFTHMNGWNEENINYFHDVRHTEHLTRTGLFRPPYGKLRPKQAQFLQRHYKVVMWSVLSGDFDAQTTQEECLKNVVNNAGKGSIIVFHDSLKSADKMLWALPRVLEHFSNQGFVFRSIDFTSRTTKQLEMISA